MKAIQVHRVLLEQTVDEDLLEMLEKEVSLHRETLYTMIF